VNPNPNPPGLRNATELNRNTPHAFNYTNCDLFNVNCTSFNKAYSPDRFLWYKSYKTVSLKHGTCTLNISAGRVHGPCPRPVRGHGRPKWRPCTWASKWYPWTRASRMCTELENQALSLEWCPGTAVSWNVNKTSAYDKITLLTVLHRNIYLALKISTKFYSSLQKASYQQYRKRYLFVQLPVASIQKFPGIHGHIRIRRSLHGFTAPRSSR